MEYSNQPSASVNRDVLRWSLNDSLESEDFRGAGRAEELSSDV